jgi:hypothetical protein
MARLSKSLKEFVYQEAYASLIKPRVEDVMDKIQQLVDKVHLADDEYQVALEYLENAPRGFSALAVSCGYYSSHNFRFKILVDGVNEELAFWIQNANYHIKAKTRERPNGTSSIGSLRYSYNDFTYDEILTGELREMALEAHEAWTSLERDKHALRDLIQSAETAKKLVELAPGLAKFLPGASNATTLVPVENVLRVNEMLEKLKHVN